nr:hypothetical protein [Tanacetum cinerariifolium]
NKNGDTAFDGKEHDVDTKKPEFEVNVSPSSSAQLEKQDDKTKKKTNGKSLVESFTGNKDLSAEFEDYYDNNNNEVKAAGSIEEGIDYKEFFAPVARIEAIRLFLAYASLMGFMVYQMDVKSAFLYGTIEEKVYVCQPPEFEDPDHPDKVYKVVKALYGLHQAARAWYETLANYLLENGFHRGKIDQTLFIKKQKGDILLVQIYVDDIIFGATNKDLCKSFEKQRKSASTPIDTENTLLKDPDGEDVDVHIYRSMIGSLIYLTSSRPDIMFAVNNVTRMQALVDKKKVVVIEAAIRDVLRLDNAEGVDCLPYEEIFVELARMGQVIKEGGVVEEHVQDVTNGDVAQGDDNAAQGYDTAAYGEVPTVS